MPSDTSRNTIARQWELLKLLPPRGAGKTARELAESLHDLGYKVSKRQVERDLGDLMELFPIDCNNAGTPYGWRWVDGAPMEIPGLSLAEALSVQIVADTLRPLLPETYRASVEPRFRQARMRLESLRQSNRAARWTDKVATVLATLPMQAPVVEEDVLLRVHQALLDDKQIAVSYLSVGLEEPKDLELHPLGLIQRNPVTYLVATAFHYTDPRLYALHRMADVEILQRKANRPIDFNLEAYAHSGALQFQDVPEKKIRFKARIAEDWLQRILEETPLAPDQKISS